jgi:hypothetical protein
VLVLVHDLRLASLIESIGNRNDDDPCRTDVDVDVDVDVHVHV